MDILLKYRLTEPVRPFDLPGKVREQACVFMRAAHSMEDNQIEYEGPAALVAKVQHTLLRSYGFRARLIDEMTRPVDLECAMQGKHMAQFEPVRISGDELFGPDHGP